jgi:hypothetical protein
MPSEFKCSHCEKSYPQKKSLNAHIKNKHQQKEHKCKESFENGNVCVEEYSSLSELKDHKRRVHKIGDIEKKHKCEHCEERYFKQSELKNHLKSHGIGVEKLQCKELLANGETCDQWFRDERTLKTHRNEHHKQKINYEYCQVILPNGCKCNHKAINKGQLKAHTESKHLKLTYPCKQDGCTHEPFCSQGGLKKHMERFHNIGDPIVIEKQRKRDGELEKLRRRKTPIKKIQKAIQTRLSDFCREKGVKQSTSLQEQVGCDYDQLEKWFEFQFTDGMSWDNYGKQDGHEHDFNWEVDHTLPCASFDFTNEDEIKKCNHWINLRPLSTKENNSKGAKCDHYAYVIQEVKAKHFLKTFRF